LGALKSRRSLSARPFGYFAMVCGPFARFVYNAA
jgi:hypothetical protein